MNRKLNVFVSYSHKLNEGENKGKWIDGKNSLIQLLRDKFSKELSIWIDTELRVHGGVEYEQEITKHIEKADIVLLLISPEFFYSSFIITKELPLMKNVYQRRIENIKKGIPDSPLIIIPINIEDPFKDSYSWIEQFQFLPSNAEYLSNCLGNFDKWGDSMSQIVNSLQHAIHDIKIARLESSKIKREENEYMFNDKEEERRLRRQTSILKKHDMHIYEDILRDKDNCSLLDVGCHNGNNIVSCFKNFHQIKRVIGIDRVPELIDVANLKYKDDVFSFHCIDCTSETLIDDIRSLGVEKFSIIHVSMLLLHLNESEPQRLLKNLYELLDDDGVIFIRDIDDSLKLAYPDSNGLFEKMFEINDKEGGSGYRSSGREVFSYLVETGYKNIKLRRKGLDTIDMDEDEKNDYFKVCFSFVRPDLERLIEKNPNNDHWKELLTWVKDNYPKMKDKFVYDDNFFFQMGFMVYTATK